MSRTVIVPSSPWTATDPPDGVTRSAFSIKFETAWRIRSWSPSAQLSGGAAPDSSTPPVARPGEMALDRLLDHAGKVDGLAGD